MALYNYEFVVTPGLEQIAAQELNSIPWGRTATWRVSNGTVHAASEHRFPLDFSTSTATAAYEVLTFNVPRPKALLGHQHFTRIIECCKHIINRKSFSTVTISAAGKDSDVMQRLLGDIATNLHLSPDPDNGDLHLRVRRSPSDGWEVLVRLTPRPWATRPWREVNMPGALHAPVAHAMVRLLHSPADARILNAGCGSGTIAVEGTLYNPETQMHAIDIDWEHITLTRKHTRLANTSLVGILQADVTKLPYRDESFHAIISDLPFGQLVNKDANLPLLYRQWLIESHRVVSRSGQGIFITHAIRLMDQALKETVRHWKLDEVVPITLNGLHPRIYLLTRLPGGTV